MGARDARRGSARRPCWPAQRWQPCHAAAPRCAPVRRSPRGRETCAGGQGGARAAGREKGSLRLGQLLGSRIECGSAAGWRRRSVLQQPWLGKAEGALPLTSRGACVPSRPPGGPAWSAPRRACSWLGRSATRRLKPPARRPCRRRRPPARSPCHSRAPPPAQRVWGALGGVRGLGRPTRSAASSGPLFVLLAAAPHLLLHDHGVERLGKARDALAADGTGGVLG